MTSDIIARIRSLQAGIEPAPDAVPPEHKPQMLLIGCVDARLNINNDIGIPYGQALVYRNIAALVAGTIGDADPAHVSEAAVLEFAVNVMQVKDIVVMGHTDCGGIRACLNGVMHVSHITQYLSPLNEARYQVTAQGGNIEQQARAMEQAAVRQSVENLMTYRAVTEAVRRDLLNIHGWVINTATRRISVLDRKTGEFKEMK